MSEVKAFFDKQTFTITYVVFDKETKDAVIIDPVLDYDPASSATGTDFTDQVLSYCSDNNLKVHYVLETHAHADHISSSAYIKEKVPGVKVAIGERITDVQETFKEIFNFGDEFKSDGSQFDALLKEGEDVQAGSLRFKTMFTPGHTPACTTFLIDDKAFVGDAIFMPDFGTGRCDFPAGSAESLYHSIAEKIYRLPDNTRLFVGHDYQPGNRELAYEATVAEEKEKNLHIKADTSREEFVKFRTERDKTLSPPRLLLQSVQVNANGGHFAAKESNGLSYLKIPITE